MVATFKLYYSARKEPGLADLVRFPSLRALVAMSSVVCVRHTQVAALRFKELCRLGHQKEAGTMLAQLYGGSLRHAVARDLVREADAILNNPSAKKETKANANWMISLCPIGVVEDERKKREVRKQLVRPLCHVCDQTPDTH